MPRFHATSRGPIPFTAAEEAQADADEAAEVVKAAERAAAQAARQLAEQAKAEAISRLKSGNGPVTRQDIQDLILALGL